MPQRCVLFPVKAVHQSIWRPRPALFHTSTAWRDDSTDHYETLGLEHGASAAAVKKQFYSLSKLHHPDRNRNDPDASSRFLKISEAYAVLGSPVKRERYDRDTRRASGQSSAGGHHHHHHGSHSSSSTPFGSRPASGLSRRRTHFKGPPPSFYRNGGWGSHGAKRQSQAEAAASTAASAGATMSDGSGLGAAQHGWNSDVPHFDRESHFRTQEQQDQRRRRRMEEGAYTVADGSGMLFKFIFVGSIVSMACFLPALFEGKPATKTKGKENK